MEKITDSAREFNSFMTHNCIPLPYSTDNLSLYYLGATILRIYFNRQDLPKQFDDFFYPFFQNTQTLNFWRPIYRFS